MRIEGGEVNDECESRTGSERGATGVEYGIMLGAIAGVIVFVAFTLGLKVQASFDSLNNLW